MFAQKYGKNNEIKKIILQYALVTITALLVGIYVSQHMSAGMLLSFTDDIKAHFATYAVKQIGIKNFLIYILYHSLSDFVCILLGFLFTFSVFNYLASDLILLYKGFCVGFSTAVFYCCVTRYAVTDYKSFAIFVIFKLLTLFFIAVFLCGLSAHSVDMKIYLPNYRFKLDIKLTLFVALYTICGIGTVVILNAIYCFLIFYL